MEKLKKELNLFQVTLAGTGVILGAGIYALIGVASGIAGNAIWLAFLIGAVIALLTGLSYAELSSMFKKDAGEYDYVEYAFNRRIALFIGLMVVFAGIVTSATVSLGFANYFSALFKTPIIYVGILLTLLLSLLNYYSIKESAWFNDHRYRDCPQTSGGFWPPAGFDCLIPDQLGGPSDYDKTVVAEPDGLYYKHLSPTDFLGLLVPTNKDS